MTSAPCGGPRTALIIPIGIRIGIDAKERLKAEPPGLSVVFHVGAKAPCPCIADGIMIATQASPGQGALQIAPDKAPDGVYAVAIIRNRKTGEALRYTIADSWIPKIIEWNKALDPAGRYDAAMNAEGLYQVTRFSDWVFSRRVPMKRGTFAQGVGAFAAMEARDYSLP